MNLLNDFFRERVLMREGEIQSLGMERQQEEAKGDNVGWRKRHFGQKVEESKRVAIMAEELSLWFRGNWI